jgi:3',5'-cyclic-AMP phosphodiesterase
MPYCLPRKPQPVLKVIHLTDPHLPPAGETLYGLDPNARLEAAVADINARHRDAALVLVTGDLARDGEPASYAALRPALDKLEAPYRLLMGNHDDRASFRAAFPDHPSDAAGFIQSVFETSAGAFVLLDTLDPGMVGGRLCPLRLDWLEASMLRLAGQSVFLAMHHPPGPIGMPTLDRIGLVEPEAFWRLLARPGQVAIRHIFCGHVHRLTHGAWRGTPFSTQRSLIHQFAAPLAPEDDRILGSHEPPAYSVALIDPDSIAIHIHEFLDESPRFDPADQAARSAGRPSELPLLAFR